MLLLQYVNASAGNTCWWGVFMMQRVCTIRTYKGGIFTERLLQPVSFHFSNQTTVVSSSFSAHHHRIVVPLLHTGTVIIILS